MKKLIVLGAVSFLASLAQADVIVCRQTEPFITEIFDTDAGTLTIQTPHDEDVHQSEVKLVFTGINSFELRDAFGKTLRSITINYKGTDGMSELIYPMDGGEGVNGGVACFSSELPTLQVGQAP